MRKNIVKQSARSDNARHDPQWLGFPVRGLWRSDGNHHNAKYNIFYTRFILCNKVLPCEGRYNLSSENQVDLCMQCHNQQTGHQPSHKLFYFINIHLGIKPTKSPRLDPEPTLS